MSYNNAISSGDPLAVEKLTTKLNSCRDLQETMKGVNTHWRKTGTCVGAPGISDAQAAKLDAKIANATVSWERVPFSDYDLKNNYAETKRLEKRIGEVTRNREVGFSGWTFDGGRAEANQDANRLQLFFDERPNDSQRATLKSYGFKWAPSQNAWQRQLNDNAIYAAGRIDFIKPTDGRSIRDIQPIAPKKSGPVR